MKLSKTLIAGSVAAATLLASAFAPLATAEVTGSVGVANMYYWRGLDLGTGDAQVSGDLKFSESGFYTGIWGGSGDSVGGTEYDVYAGYGNTVGDFFKYDLSLWTYVYPSAPEVDEEGAPIDAFNEVGELSEAVVTLGFGPVSVTYMDNIAGGSGYWYSTVGVAFDKFTLTYGLHETDLAHVDLGYAYNDKLTFKAGFVVDDADGGYDNDPKFVVAYNLPIGE